MNILLHICCAPCSLFTIDKLRQDGHKVQGFFYNPNIYPLTEYKLRRQAVVDMAKRLSIKIIYNDSCQRTSCSTPTFVTAKQQRCVSCWRRRLSEAANTARQERCDAFTTTLLISPYQNHDEIWTIGRDLEKKEEVDFYYDDFRTGFKQSQAMAREQGVYRQKYCGCELSIEESKKR